MANEPPTVARRPQSGQTPGGFALIVLPVTTDLGCHTAALESMAMNTVGPQPPPAYQGPEHGSGPGHQQEHDRATAPRDHSTAQSASKAAVNPVMLVAGGEPCLDAVLDVLGKRAQPLDPAMVVAPSALAAVALRRELAIHAKGLAGVEVSTLLRVAERIADPEMHRQGLRVASSLELQAAVAAELTERPLGFGAVADHPATHDRLVRLAAETAGASRSELAAAGREGGLIRSALSVLEGAERRLGQAVMRGMVLQLAVDLVDNVAPWSWGPVVLFEPNPANPGERRLLKRLVVRPDVTVISVATGFDSIDGPHRVRLHGFGCITTGPEVSGQGFRRIEVGDPDDEVRTALAEVYAGADEVPLSRSAVLYTTADPYGTLLADQAAEAELALSGPGLRPLVRSVGGVTLRRLLDMVQNGVSRVLFEQFLTATPAVDGLDPRLTSRWIADARDAGVVEPDSWDDSLGRAMASARSDDPRSETVARLEALVEFVSTLRTDCTIEPGANWGEIGEWLTGLLDRYCPAGPDWPRPELSARERLVEMLSSVSGLDRIGPPPPLGLLVTGLISQMEETSTAGRPYGHGLLAAPISSVAGVPTGRVVVVGVADGTYPRRRRDDSILTPSARAALELTEPNDAAAIQARSVAVALASSMAVPLVVNSRGDLRSRRVRDWPRDLTGIIADVDEVPSHSQALERSALPASLSEFELGSMVAARRRPESHPLGQTDPVLGPALARVRLTTSGQFGPYTGQVPASMVNLDEVRLSATALESYAQCPRKYLLNRYLRLGASDVPDRIEELSNRDRGSLLHDILDSFLAAEIDGGRVPEPDEAWSPAAIERLRGWGTSLLDHEARLGRSGGRVTTRIEGKRIQRELARWVVADNAHRSERRATPILTEWEFGFGAEPALVTGADGHSIRLRGLVDRIDRTDDDGLIVIDYKSGSGKAFQKFAADPLASGTRLQLGLYAIVAAEALGASGGVLAMYWMLNADRPDPHLLPITDEITDRIRGYVSAARQGISDGLFPGRPGEESNFPRARSYEHCQFCDVNAICPTDRRVEWDRLADAPELQALEVFGDA